MSAAPRHARPPRRRRRREAGTGSRRPSACRSTSSRELQIERLRATLRHAYDNVPFYRAEARRGRHRRRTSVDLPRRRRRPARSPPRSTCATTTRSACSPCRGTRSCACTPRSGTTGNPTVVGYTRADIDVWGDLIARTLAAGGVGPGDLLQNAYGYGLFTGGLGLHYGGEHLGCTVLPISGGNTERQLKLMRDFGATGSRCTPSYALYLAEAAHDRGLGPDDLPIRVGYHGAEPWTNEMRVQIEARPRHRRARHLRPLRDGRPGRLVRVSLQERHARQRGPLPGRDRRPRDAAAAARG